jgi:hypothetical protein
MKLGSVIRNGRNMSNGCLQIVCPEQRWNEACEDVGKDGRTNNVLCFKMVITVLKSHDKEVEKNCFSREEIFCIAKESES